MKTTTSLLAALGCLAATGVFASTADVVDAILDGAAGAKYLVVGDGPLAARLRERAPEAAPGLFVVALRGETQERMDAFRLRAAADAPTKRAADASEFESVPFLAAWLRDEPESGQAAFLFADAPAAVALAPGFAAIPAGGAWRVGKAGEIPAPRDLAAFESVRDLLGETLAGQDGDGGDAALETALRRHFSRLANDLGRRLALAGLRQAARGLFEGAAALLPGDPSAPLNLASLERSAEKADPEARARIAATLQSLRHQGGVLAMDGGVLLRPQDFFDAGWFWTLSGLDAADTNATAEALSALPENTPREQFANLVRVSFTLQRGNAEGMVAFLAARVGPDGLSPATRLEAAEAAVATTGDSARAVALLDRFAVPGGGGVPEGTECGGRPFWFQAAAKEAGVLGNMGDGAKLESLMARLQAALADDPAALAEAGADVLGPAFVDLSRWDRAAAAFATAAEAGAGATAAALSKAAGALAGGDADSAAKAAAALLEDEGEESPVPWAALRIALEAAFRRGDQAAAEAVARRLLAARPRDAFAHWILGNLAIASGDRAAAMGHLQASVAIRPAWYALNDLSSLQTEIGNPAQGEVLARLALRNGGDATPTIHETLGEALFAQDKAEEAAAEFRVALGLAAKAGTPPQPPTLLKFAEALFKAGDVPAAAEALVAVDAVRDGLDIPARERLGALRRAVAEALGSSGAKEGGAR